MKYFCILPVFLLAYANSFSQKSNIEIRAGAGYLSDAHFADAIANGSWKFILYALPFVKHDFKIKTGGVYSADILVQLKNKHLQAGASYSLERLSITEYNNYKATTFKRDISCFMPEAHYTYFTKAKMNLYYGIAIGIKFSDYSGETSKSSGAKFAYHFTCLGFSYGNHIKAFGEFGFGAKGLIRGGVAFSL